jgi:hypothetical protein
MIENNFSKETIDYVDRLCRLTDGAGSERYTLYEFLQLINQQSLYSLYQPRLPNNILLFKIFENALNQNNNVDILLNTTVTKIYNQNNKSESFANWYYEKKLMGYTYGKDLKDIFRTNSKFIIIFAKILLVKGK